METNGAVVKDKPGTVTPYMRWIREQRIPIVEAYGVTDLREQQMAHWEHLGCPAYFVQLRGMEGVTAAYVAEIPAGGATKSEQHLYEEIIYILEGSGSTVVDGPEGQQRQFEWQEGSFFAIPLNAPHRLFASGKSVRFIAFTTASMVFDLYHSEKFVFGTPFAFLDRFAGEDDYFQRDVREEEAGNTLLGFYTRRTWETNFVPDLRAALPDPVDAKVRSLRFIKFEIAGNTLVAHLSKYPVGRYMQGHYHAGGAILLILRSEGYSLMWPNELGERPFESGHGDRVIRVDWKPGAIFSPPSGWFHQHFNTGNEAALQLAIRHGSQKYPTGLWLAQTGMGDIHGVMVPSGEGGTMIPYEREDPAMARMFGEALAKKGIPVAAR